MFFANMCIILSFITCLGMLVLYMNTPEKNIDIMEMKNLLFKQKLKLIMNDYQNIALQPSENIIRTLNLYKGAITFKLARMKYFQDAFKDEKHIEEIEPLIIITQKINELLNRLIENLKNLNFDTDEMTIFDVLETMKVRISTMKKVLQNVEEKIIEYQHEIQKFKVAFLLLDWKSETTFYDDFNIINHNVHQPLKDIFNGKLESLEKISIGVKHFCAENSMFSNRLNLLLEVVAEWNKSNN